MSDDKVVPIQPDPFPLSQHPTIRIEALERRCSELQSKLHTASERFEALRTERNDLFSRLDESEKGRREMINRGESWREMCDELEERYRNALQAFQREETRADNAERDRDDALHRLDSAGIDIAEATGQIEHLDRENNSLRSLVQAMMARLADLLDSDHFNNIEAMVLEAGVPFPPVVETHGQISKVE